MVEFEYFEKLDQECRDLILKYRQKDYWKECHDLKGEEILYEIRPISFRIPQHLGRYDCFFYWNFKGKPYKPGKLLTKAPHKHEYWKYHLVDGNLKYVEFYQIWEKHQPKPVGNIYVPVEDGCIAVDKEGMKNLYIIQSKENYTRYISIYPLGFFYLKENEPQSIIEDVVSKDKKHFDRYVRNRYSYSHTLFELHDDGFYGYVIEDSKYLKKEYAFPKAKPGYEYIVQRFETPIRKGMKGLLDAGFKEV